MLTDTSLCCCTYDLMRQTSGKIFEERSGGAVVSHLCNWLLTRPRCKGADEMSQYDGKCSSYGDHKLRARSQINNIIQNKEVFIRPCSENSLGQICTLASDSYLPKRVVRVAENLGG